MLQSKLFTKTRREAPSDEASKNAQLLIRAGYINKEMAGVYDFLPLGLMVLKKIENIVRTEMNAIGGQEIVMSSLQNKEVWEKTDRWGDEKVDNWFKTKFKNNTEVGLGFTHEEPLTKVMTDHIKSFRDLPQYIYQFQTKFRNESRAKSGIMRGREFLMKDMYSFSTNHKQHEEFYQKVKDAYRRIFDQAGIGDVTYLTYASGGTFSESSHEFQAVSSAGEDTIFIREENDYAVNKEVFNEEWRAKHNMNKLREEKAIEVGNIFHLGTKFSEALGLTYKEIDGSNKPVWMGSYGIGISRLMGTIVEVLSDDKGIVWPESVAPFKYHIVEIQSENKQVGEMAEKIYRMIGEENALYDDREARAGEKFADADLLGIPNQIIISEKNLASGKLELKNRKLGEIKMMGEDEFSSNLC